MPIWLHRRFGSSSAVCVCVCLNVTAGCRSDHWQSRCWWACSGRRPVEFPLRSTIQRTADEIPLNHLSSEHPHCRDHTQTHNCQRPKHPFLSHSTEKLFPNRPRKHLEHPFPNQRDKKTVSPDAAGVCVPQFCCVRRYGPQSNSPVLWASGQQTLFWIPAAAAHLQTQQPIRNKPRHIYIERERHLQDI